MIVSTTLSLTVKVATPDALVTPATVVIVEEPPDLASETVWPGTGLAFASTSVTVIVEVVLPSATTETGHATTVEPRGAGACRGCR